MEDELQQTTDQKMWLEVNMQTRKTHFGRDLAAKEELRKEKRRGMAKQLRDRKTELYEEREQKQAVANIKKKLETEYKDLEVTMNINNKEGRKDILKQLKKLQQAMKELLTERAIKNQISIEQLKTELASEQGNAHKREYREMMLEKQNEEPKVKLEQVNIP